MISILSCTRNLNNTIIVRQTIRSRSQLTKHRSSMCLY
uniref:Uncharacterized protein n=1 Tax=Arundo donax TaxID=35708 RepID=A0A0A9QI06_ARUDO